MTQPVNLETFDFDHLEGDLHDVGQQFHDTMLFLSFNLPAGHHLAASLRYLEVSRQRALDAIENQEEEDRAAAAQLDLDLPGTANGGDLRFPSFKYIPPT
tara:strand:+ start:460 stop:759 length:300 start_codon:yes stop_codon:yes gene_type:complete